MAYSQCATKLFFFFFYLKKKGRQRTEGNGESNWLQIIIRQNREWEWEWENVGHVQIGKHQKISPFFFSFFFSLYSAFWRVLWDYPFIYRLEIKEKKRYPIWWPKQKEMEKNTLFDCLL